MRAVLAPFAVVVSVGCAHLQDYESVQAGPRAKINFSSPFLEDRFMSFNRLDLFVYEADERCSFTSKCTIPVSVRGNEVSTYVPATRRAYSIVRQLRSESLSGRNLNATLGFSFVPEDGLEYTIEHIDNPAALRVKYYKHGKDGRKLSIEVQGLDACK